MNNRSWQKRKQQPAEDNFFKINFISMPLEYEIEIALARRAFIMSQMRGSEMMLKAIKILESMIVSQYRDTEYRATIKELENKMEKEISSCRNQYGLNTDKVNQIIETYAMKRWEAVNELFYRKAFAPRRAEEGILD